MWRTKWEGFHLCRPRVYADRVRLPIHAGRLGDRVSLPVHAGHPGDRVRLLVHTGRPGDWTASPPTLVIPATGTTSSTTSVIRATEVESHHPTVDEEGPQLPGRQPCWISGGKIDPSSTSYYIITLVYAHIPGPVDSWKEFPPSIRELLFDIFTWRYVFTRPEDLPRARVVWESTAQTNFKRSIWEARYKATKTTGSWDPMAWMDYGPVWLRRDYWESLCHRWATGLWQERLQAAKHNRAAHPEKNVHTNGSVSYATHS
ncbi:hypothetical protein Taro_043202 [Colocasia esculenta]|uniref:Uncharacterized protein n=1 Tax=Colocasia esculenta TaxID=4460 RepID=A0A843WKF7_COLES|nr:hypothetical protein [Colocasia esculenta]